jgi:KUP system potassium uptake protein
MSCIALVLGFQSSANRTGAYGIAVTGTMTITSLLFYQVSRDCWKWPVWRAGGLTALFLTVDLLLLVPNGVKILHGGWVPILIAVFIYVLMTTWHRGREILSKSLIEQSNDLTSVMAKVEKEKPHRVAGTAIFFTSHQEKVPSLLLHNYKINQVLPENVIILSLSFARIPYTPNGMHGKLTELGNGFYQIVSEYGFMQRPRVDDILRNCQRTHPEIDLKTLNFYIGRDIIFHTGKSKMARWRKDLFAFILLNSQRPSEALKIKPELVVEIGTAVEL